jgi:hypothetical protein
VQIKDILYHNQIRENIFEFGNHRCDKMVANVMKSVE